MSVPSRQVLSFLRRDHLIPIGLIVLGVLSPLTILMSAPITWPRVPILMLIVAMSIVGGIITLRAMGGTYIGGTLALPLLWVLGSITVLLGLGIGVVMMFAPPTGLPWLALPGIVLVMCSLFFVDVAYRGLVHSWMLRVGFGRAFLLIVPTVLTGCVFLPLSLPSEPIPTIALSASLASFIGGCIRLYSDGLVWMLTQAVMLLIALLLAT